ncbi:T9SS type A sorting domain-containing protein [Rurimicrobium arvi]|uniref:Secretion system C-terminal sorting domain-containing protein n=1 Tax=Rurimicrobium arvi TaxID=2049916 RepID=A0ABP8N1R0_9BACT
MKQKHFCAFLLAAGIPAVAAAQQSFNANSLLRLSDTKEIRAAVAKHAYELGLQSAGKGTTAKTTAVQSRLIAKASRTYDAGVAILTDSARCVYSGDRGGDLNSEIKSDSLYNYQSLTFGAPLVTNSRTYTSYNSGNRRISDTSERYSSASSSFSYTSRNTLTYNTFGQISTQLLEMWSGTWIFSIMDKMSYDASGRQLADTGLNSLTPGDYNYVSVNTYDAGGKLLTISDKNFTAGTWVDFSELAYTYNAAGYCETFTARYNTGGTGLVNVSKASYLYNASGKPVTINTYIWNTGTATWDNDQVMVYRYDASGYLSRISVAMWNSSTAAYDSIVRVDFTNNIHGQATSESSFSFDSGSWKVSDGDHKYNYYYEDYTTGVKELQAQQAEIRLFPVPAADELELQIRQEHPQALEVAVIDLQGRVCISKQYAAAANISDRISVARLPSGNYLLRLNNGTVRSFVVTH